VEIRVIKLVCKKIIARGGLPLKVRGDFFKSKLLL